MRVSIVMILAWCASIMSIAAPATSAAERVDLSKLDKTIARQPKYTAEQPLYGLVVIGRSVNNRIWMVFDKSKSDAESYDVLYADLNGNGDLTEASEKFSRTEGRTGRVRFDLPDFTDPQTGATHTEFYVSVSSREPATHMVSLKWSGLHKLGGGYPADPAKGYMQFGATPKNAPIIRLNGDGPFQFQRWFSNEFTIGGGDDLKLFLGAPGVGQSSFCAFQRHVLKDDEPVLATLIYTDQAGDQQKADFKLKERC